MQLKINYDGNTHGTELGGANSGAVLAPATATVTATSTSTSIFCTNTPANSAQQLPSGASTLHETAIRKGGQSTGTRNAAMAQFQPGGSQPIRGSGKVLPNHISGNEGSRCRRSGVVKTKSRVRGRAQTPPATVRGRSHHHFPHSSNAAVRAASQRTTLTKALQQQHASGKLKAPAAYRHGSPAPAKARGKHSARLESGSSSNSQNRHHRHCSVRSTGAKAHLKTAPAFEAQTYGRPGSASHPHPVSDVTSMEATIGGGKVRGGKGDGSRCASHAARPMSASSTSQIRRGSQPSYRQGHGTKSAGTSFIVGLGINGLTSHMQQQQQQVSAGRAMHRPKPKWK
ncbi:unnamed protein product [Chrysoparadoxa australica]